MPETPAAGRTTVVAPRSSRRNAEQIGDGLFSLERLRFFAATALLVLVFLLVLLSGWGDDAAETPSPKQR